MVYGSAAGVGYNHGVSNINICVILKNLDFSVLKQNAALVKSVRRQNIAVPLFLTKEYILNALDVFPIEFSEIKEQHKVIYGEDLFKDLDIPLKDVRLLCEQQVKGKLLHLRQAYLASVTPFDLKHYLASALNDLIPVFRQLIIIKGQKPCEEKEGLLRQLAGIFALDEDPLLHVYHNSTRKVPQKVRFLFEPYFQNFLAQLDKLSRHMDSL